jgi:thioredoxin reductase (NADPH)
MTTTEVENYPGYPEGISGPQMMDDFKKQAVRFGTRIQSRNVTRVDLSAWPFTLWAGEDEFKTKTLIIATGAVARYLGLPSEEKFMNKGVSACATCDGALPRFRNNPVVVVGGGDTAMEESLFLAKFASEVHIIHRRDQFRASRIMGDRALAEPKIHVHWNSVVDEILGDDDSGVNAVRIKDVNTGETTDIPARGYFAAIGHKPATELFEGMLDMDEAGYLICKPDSTYTRIEGVFAAGDVKDKIYRQAVTAAGSGCAAAIDATRWLEAKEAEVAQAASTG